MRCELVVCERPARFGVSFEARTGDRLWFIVCSVHAVGLREVHRRDGWYQIRMAESMAELGLEEQ